MAKQAGETGSRKWDWVERSVWTDRMLEALEQGVKGGVWFSLIDKHCSEVGLLSVDSWIRGRLRSILRRRSGRRGRGRGRDHQRWPNAYFRKLGLFCLEDARVAALQSLRGNH